MEKGEGGLVPRPYVAFIACITNAHLGGRCYVRPGDKARAHP